MKYKTQVQIQRLQGSQENQCRWTWEEILNYQERRTTDQPKHPSTFYLCDPRHKLPVHPTTNFSFTKQLHCSNRLQSKAHHLEQVWTRKDQLPQSSHAHFCTFHVDFSHSVNWKSVTKEGKQEQEEWEDEELQTSPFATIKGSVSVCCQPDVNGANIECPSHFLQHSKLPSYNKISHIWKMAAKQAKHVTCSNIPQLTLPSIIKTLDNHSLWISSFADPKMSDGIFLNNSSL